MFFSNNSSLFLDGFGASSKTKRRGAPPLYEALQLNDGGEDPLRAWGNLVAPKVRAIFPKKSPPSLDKIPRCVGPLPPVTATMSQQAEKAAAAAQDLLKVDAARMRKFATVQSRKSQGAAA